LAGKTESNAAGRVGIGIPTVTTYKGQEGTGILWISDPNAGIQAFKAVPNSAGVLTPILLPPTGGLNKFQRPAFGDGRLYVSDGNGVVYCLGYPVNLPLNCTQPVDFGNVAIGDTATLNVNCTALIAISSFKGCSTGDHTFQCSNSTLPQGALAQGAKFSFPVVWNLTQAAINDAQNASFGKVLPGIVTTSLIIYTTNGVSQYTDQVPISLRGNTVSSTAFLSVSPAEIDFGGIIVNGSGQALSLSASVIVSNTGAQVLIFTGFAWTPSIDETITYTNLTINPDGSKKVGTAFSSSSFPNVGGTLDPGQSVTVPLLFTAATVGSYSSILQFWSNGGGFTLLLSGSAATAPVANISVSTAQGDWDYTAPLVMDFGDVLASTSASRNIRLCNSGGSALTITKSKPPIDPELFAARPLTDLHEGQTIDVDSCALGEVDIVGAGAVVNQPPELLSNVWVLNADGLNANGTPWGVHEVQIKARITRKQVGPLLSDGQARYKYLGCYLDLTAGRLLPNLYSGGSSNENGFCTSTCLANGYRFAGTEYRKLHSNFEERGKN